MTYKSRDISLNEYLQLLQREYVCTLIRTEIYTLANDIRHFHKVLEKKKAKIENISEKLECANIFNDVYTKDALYAQVIPNWGFPNFVYNERVRPDDVKKKYLFPYSGTLVRVENIGIGLTDYVDFEKETVFVKIIETNKIEPFHYTLIHRLPVEDVDKYYYYNNAPFICRFRGADDYGKSLAYELGANVVKIKWKSGEITEEHINSISRILNLK